MAICSKLVLWQTLAFAVGLVLYSPLRAVTVEETRFDIWEFEISDTGLIPMANVEQAVYPYLGVGRTIVDVEAARRAVEAQYHKHGFGTVVVIIPEQAVDQGVVRLETLDGRVERLHVTGARYFSFGRLKSRLSAVAVDRTPNIPEFQRQLAEVARASSDRRVTPVLRPGRGPGTVEVELKVEDKLPLHGSLEINDDYTNDTTRTRIQADVRYVNLWQREHSLGVAYQFSPEDPTEVQVLTGTYLFRVDDSDLLYAIYGVASDSEVTTLGGQNSALGVVGKGAVVGVRAIRPLPADIGSARNLTFGLDYKDFNDRVAPLGSAGFETPISYARLVTGLDSRLELASARFDYRLNAQFGFRGLGNSPREFENKRFKAKPNFLYLTAELNYLQQFEYGALSWRLAGQLSSGALVSNEQFSLGGERSVRGYLATQVLADSAVQSQLEWTSQSFATVLKWDWLRRAQAVLFLDAGYGTIDSPLPGQERSSSLAGAGIGLRLLGLHGLYSAVDWAFPLIAEGEISSYDSRLHVKLGYEF